MTLLPPPLARSYPSESKAMDAVRFPNIVSSSVGTMKTRYTVADWMQSKTIEARKNTKIIITIWRV